MFNAVQKLQATGFIHGNLSPESFRICNNKVVLTDFSKVKEFAKNGNHIPGLYEQQLPFQRLKYASCNQHEGLSPSRRDDLECLGYIYLELLNNLIQPHEITSSR